jgi:hypothetical protein
MNKASISLKAKSNFDRGLLLKLKLDGVLIGSMPLDENEKLFAYEFDDTPKNHRFEIELCNKKPEHIKLNENGEIIEDVTVEIFDVCLSNIDLGQVFYGKSLYFHDHNGSSKPVVGQFFRQLGCNGTIQFDFYTPAYVWLMENI